MKHAFRTLLSGLFLVGLLGGRSLANDTTTDGLRFSKLPHGGMTSKTPGWVHGITPRMEWPSMAAKSEPLLETRTDHFSDHNDPERLSELSPAEKLTATWPGDSGID